MLCESVSAQVSEQDDTLEEFSRAHPTHEWESERRRYPNALHRAVCKEIVQQIQADGEGTQHGGAQEERKDNQELRPHAKLVPISLQWRGQTSVPQIPACRQRDDAQETIGVTCAHAPIGGHDAFVVDSGLWHRR